MSLNNLNGFEQSNSFGGGTLVSFGNYQCKQTSPTYKWRIRILMMRGGLFSRQLVAATAYNMCCLPARWQ
jgi:hypothetical protein